MWIKRRYEYGFYYLKQETNSILPLCYDRLKANDHPMYGLDTARLGNANRNVDDDSEVLDFLRKDEGPIAEWIIVEDTIRAAWPATMN